MYSKILMPIPRTWFVGAHARHRLDEALPEAGEYE
jgi:hypothetical protein